MYSQSTISHTGDITLSSEAQEFFYELEPIIKDCFEGVITKEKMRHLLHFQIATFEAVLNDETQGRVDELENELSDKDKEIKDLEKQVSSLENKNLRCQQNANEADLMSENYLRIIDELKGRLTIHGVDFSDIDE